MLVCSGKDYVKNQSSFCFDIYKSYRISSVYLVKIWKTLENNLDVYMYKWMWLSQNNFILKKWSVKACTDPEIFSGVERVGVREIILLARGGGGHRPNFDNLNIRIWEVLNLNLIWHTIHPKSTNRPGLMEQSPCADLEWWRGSRRPPPGNFKFTCINSQSKWSKINTPPPNYPLETHTPTENFSGSAHESLTMCNKLWPWGSDPLCIFAFSRKAFTWSGG